MKKTCFVLFLFAISIMSCGKNSTSPDNPPDPPDSTTTNFAKGADLSWLTEMENNGYKFYTREGTQKDCYQVLKEEGMNSIRLRAWVDPANGW